MKYVIAVRREDINRWEKRVPIVPADARQMIEKHGLELIVQPSDIRVFPDEEYRRAGAAVAEDICPSRVVFALKEIPLELIEQGKTYVFFSHTAKGQPQNMPMLRRMMEKGCTVIDYEKMVDDKGRRVLYFGNYAGHAGMVDTLWALGRRLELEGIRNPFMGLRQTWRYQGLAEVKAAVRETAERIDREGVAPELRPLVFGFLGYGHVSQGAQEIFDLLPHEALSPGDLPGLFEKGGGRPDRLYKVVFKEEDMVEPAEAGLRFELQHYYDHPEKYRPVVERYAPFLTAMVNGIYWTPRYPKFVTKAFLKRHYAAGASPRLRVIGDIACDINGSLECTVMPTDSSNPVYVYDPEKDEARLGFEGRGPLVLAVYNLPAELPVEASNYFSAGLRGYVPEIAAADRSRDLASCGFSDVVRRAVIVYRGELAPDYRYLEAHLRPFQK